MSIPCLRSFRMLLASDHLKHIHPRSTFELHCCENARICQLKIIHHSFYKKTQISIVHSLCRPCTLSSRIMSCFLYMSFCQHEYLQLFMSLGPKKSSKSRKDCPRTTPSDINSVYKHIICKALLQQGLLSCFEKHFSICSAPRWHKHESRTVKLRALNL